jgi:hypothetical protein
LIIILISGSAVAQALTLAEGSYVITCENVGYDGDGWMVDTASG